MCPCYRRVLPSLKRRGWRDCSTNDSPLLLAGTSLSSSGHCLGWMVAASPEDWLTAPSFSRLPLAPTTVRTKCRHSPENPANPPFHLSTHSLSDHHQQTTVCLPLDNMLLSTGLSCRCVNTVTWRHSLPRIRLRGCWSEHHTRLLLQLSSQTFWTNSVFHLSLRLEYRCFGFTITSRLREARALHQLFKTSPH